MEIEKLISYHAKTTPTKEFVIFQGQYFSFKDTQSLCLKFSVFLHRQGIVSQDRVAIFLPNSFHYVVSVLGLFFIKATVVPLDFMLTEEEMINIINHSEVRFLIAKEKKGIDFARIKQNCPSLKGILIDGDNKNFSSWKEVIDIKENKIEVDRKENDLACILYTSGSTGHPKGVMLSFKNLNTPINCINHFLKLSSEDIFLCPGVPFSHIGGLDYILLSLYFGGKLIIMDKFQPYEFLKNVEKFKVTIFWIVPSMYVAILSLKEIEKFNLSSVRYAVVFGAPSSPQLLKRFHQSCPQAKLLNGWGMTETSAPNCILPPEIEKIESIGKFYPGFEAKIVDEDGNSLKANQKGELWVRGEGVMQGYFKEPSLTEEVLTSDGWLKTGDLAYFDDEGLFYIAGRKKDIIKVAGEVVFLNEVEEKIALHPQVKEAAVIGVKDELRGEVPKAFLVLKDNSQLNKEELRDFLKEHLAHFKLPHYFEFVKELPKTRTGKVNKQLLSTKG